MASRDHPRSRGEYALLAQLKGKLMGSSPLSRGIPYASPDYQREFATASHGVERERGIIPALAGNTTPPPGSWSPARDHPRSRGEYMLPWQPCPKRRGSSPLSRGILPASASSRRAHGIIPALAGNTPPSPNQSPCGRDHPRSRGEYCFCCPSRMLRPGSSPLSRGIPQACGRQEWEVGIIPALAGNTM